MSIKFEFSGMFNLIVRDAKTLAKKRETGFFKNIITDYGLNRIGTSGVLTGAYVGSGTETPSPSDVSLQSPIARTSMQLSENIITGPDVAPYYGGVSKTYRFAEGVAAGNISEVGIIALYSGAYPLWSRSLVLDSSGSPTTITVLPNEVLDIVYECRAYAMPSDTTGGPLTLLGVDYNWTMRAINARRSTFGLFTAGFAGGPQWDGTNGEMVAVTATKPSGVDSGTSGSLIAAQYSENSYKRSFTFSFSITQGNSSPGGIKTMYGTVVSNGPNFQIGLDKIFPKNNLNTISLSFEVSWARKAI